MVLGGAEAEVDRHGHLGLGQLSLDPVPADALPEPAADAESLPALNGEARAIIARLDALARESAKEPSDRAVVSVASLAAILVTDPEAV